MLQSANAVTSPRDKITRITSSSPADARSPFYDPTDAPMKPLARIVMTRQRVYEKSCTDTSLLTEDIGHPDNTGDALRRNHHSKYLNNLTTLPLPLTEANRMDDCGEYPKGQIPRIATIFRFNYN